MFNFKRSQRKIVKSVLNRDFYRRNYKKTTTFIKKRPLTSFFIVLALLLLVIIIGNILGRPKQAVQASNQPKSVRIYSIGEAPIATFQAKVDKSGTVKIVALAPGIVQQTFVNEGDSVYQGTQLLSLSSNYSGGNAPALAAQIADATYQNVLNTFDTQKDLISKQRDIANKSHDNVSDLQTIAGESANNTQDLVNANQNLLDSLKAQLESDKSGGAAQSTINAEESQINQLQGGQNQLIQALKNLREQSDTNKPQAQLSDIQRDLTLEQLNLQEKSLDLNKEVSRLSADLAFVNAAAMNPSSPFAGIVERVYIKPGQQVNPGTPLMQISSPGAHVRLLVNVPGEVAKNVSKIEPSILYVKDKTYVVRPTFISEEATDGQLYSVIYQLPDDVSLPVSDGQYLKIDIPMGESDTSSAFPFIPLDAVYQTQDSNYLLVVKNKKASALSIKLGDVFGSFVEVTKGLELGDQVILDRNVTPGDSVKIN